MRKSIVVLIVFLYAFLGHSFSQEKEIREDMTVTNVEVPVRVFLKGKPVKGLKQSDFALFERGKKQEINGFYEVSRVIERESVQLASEREENYQPRYFVLVFRITSVPGDLEKSVAYLFKDVLRTQDQLLVFMNNKTVFFKDLKQKEQMQTLLMDRLREQAMIEKFRFEKYFLKVVGSLDQARLQSQLELDRMDSRMVAKSSRLFLKNYLRIWREYKRRYLVPDIDTYYNFSKFLEKIALEKWVISFYQFEKFPELKLSGKFRRELRNLIGDMMGSAESENLAIGQILSQQINTIDRELKVAEDFPSEEISRLFSKVNVTFHSMFFTSYNDINSQDLSFKEISTDIENSLRKLTRLTGGELIVSNKLKKSLEDVVRQEDTYYMLTYSPESEVKRGKIKVVVENKEYKIQYDNNIHADYISEYLKKRESEVTFVKLKDIGFFGKELSFRVTDIMRKDSGSVSEGSVKVHIVVKTPENKSVYDQSKIVRTKKGDLSIDIKMDWLKPGEYDLTIDVSDILSSRSAFEYLKIKVN